MLNKYVYLRYEMWNEKTQLILYQLNKLYLGK